MIRTPEIAHALSRIRKVCGCCQKECFGVPEAARFGGDDALEGWYWECACHSTLFVALDKIQPKAAA